MKNIAYKYKINHINLAFTLAEVLIVLGIIGIVAAMTIPTLMQKIQDMEFKTAAKKAYSVTSEALKKMNYDYGTTYADYINTTKGEKVLLKDRLMPYFKVLKDCRHIDCVPQTSASSIYKDLT